MGVKRLLINSIRNRPRDRLMNPIFTLNSPDGGPIPEERAEVGLPETPMMQRQQFRPLTDARRREKLTNEWKSGHITTREFRNQWVAMAVRNSRKLLQPSNPSLS